MRKKGKSKGRSGFWGGILLGGIIAGAAAYFVPRLLKDGVDHGTAETATPPPPKAKVVPESSPSAKPKPQLLPQAATSKPAGGIALFRRPDVAAGLAVRAGLGESYPGSLRWKKTDALGWNSFASLNMPVRGIVAHDGEDNTVTSLLESKTADRIENVLLVANIANPRGEAETMDKFRTLALAFLSETGCPVTRQFVDAIGVTDMETKTADAFYALKKINLGPASRWELSIKSK